jgi:hypothetical protein
VKPVAEDRMRALSDLPDRWVEIPDRERRHGESLSSMPPNFDVVHSLKSLSKARLA